MHPKRARFVPRTLDWAANRRLSQAAREGEAKAAWDSLTPEQEGWVLRKMRFAKMGHSK